MVHMIVAKIWCACNGAAIGFPAYDKNSALVGFYKEKVDERKRTTMEFEPICTSSESCGLILTEVEVIEATSLLKESNENEVNAGILFLCFYLLRILCMYMRMYVYRYRYRYVYRYR